MTSVTINQTSAESVADRPLRFAARLIRFAATGIAKWWSTREAINYLRDATDAELTDLAVYRCEIEDAVRSGRPDRGR